MILFFVPGKKWQMNHFCMAMKYLAEPLKNFMHICFGTSLTYWTGHGRIEVKQKTNGCKKKCTEKCQPAAPAPGGEVAARVIEVAHVAAARAVRVTKRATNVETENAKILIMAPEAALGLRITDLKLVTS